MKISSNVMLKKPQNKSGVFQLKLRTASAQPMPKEVKKKMEDGEEPPMQRVQGKMPDSLPEWRMVLALRELRIDFRFHQHIEGGHLRGGQIVDFMVDTVPFKTPVFVNGVYWHRNESKAEQDLKIMQIERVYGGNVNPAVIIYDYELPDIESAIRICKTRLII